MKHRPLLLVGFSVAAVVVLLTAVLFLVGKVYSEQGTAIRELEERGGRVVMTHGSPPVLRKWLGGRFRRFFDRATLVNLSNTSITDRDLRLLGRLQGLERLNLSRTSVTDRGMRYVEPLEGLKALDLSQTQITDRGLKHFRHLESLKFLYLNGTAVTDAGLRHLEGLDNLQELKLMGTETTPAGIEKLRGSLPEVKVFHNEFEEPGTF